jgi:methylated-DNA-[protein]-cysteine S-methyltransferase
LAADSKGLRHLVFPSGSRTFETPDDWETRPREFVQVIKELNEYFDGTRQKFDVKLAPAGTDFQRSVWLALLSVPYAETSSYGQIAETIGKPKASRAVGAANGANPIPIIVPCHRVIGSSGNLTGFGGGLETKSWLLAHERGEGQLFGFTTP